MREKAYTKKAFTLVEVIISLLLVAFLASTVLFGFSRFYRHMELKKAQERVERLLSQADILSTILQQEATILFIQKHSSWYAVLKPWGDEEFETLSVFAHLPANFVELNNIKTLRLNDSELSELSLTFLPMKGIDLSYVKAKDSMERSLTARELGLMPSHSTESSIILFLEGKGNKEFHSIDLKPYARITTHLSIPQEYQDLDT